MNIKHHRFSFKFLPILGLFMLFGCQSNPAKPPITTAKVNLTTAYDYQLLNATANPTTLSEVITHLKQADVVLIGEFHGNHASHLLQMQLLSALHQQNLAHQKNTQLSMEMFTRDQQPILNDYLDGFIGERYLINEAPAWNNYAGSYRPLIEYAKQHEIPVIAANASGEIVRCIGQQGATYLEKLTTEQKTELAKHPFTDITGYEKKFFGFMLGQSEKTPNQRQKQSYLAQLTRDNTMAESIWKALQQSPNTQVIHLNGRFHSAEHLGTAGALTRLQPNLNIQVITPIHLPEFTDLTVEKRPDNFYYLLNPQPDEFVDPEYRKKIRKNRFDRAKEKAKSCL